MKVFKIGTKVKVGGDISAIIVGIAIYTSSVDYKVVYWDDRTRKSEWVAESEILLVDEYETKQNIGFK
jgi:hypothetical protein